MFPYFSLSLSISICMCVCVCLPDVRGRQASGIERKPDTLTLWHTEIVGALSLQFPSSFLGFNFSLSD